MAVQILVDSASDILPSEAARLGVVHLPLKVLFGEEEYADAVTLSHRQFYEKLTQGEVFPTTCQIPPADFAAVFDRVVAAGDTAVVITLSGAMSGTYQSATIAAQDYVGKIFVVDSRNVAVGERILVLRGVALREMGLDAEAIAAQLTKERARIRQFAVLDTLEYLKKGGRISAATAFAGSLLAIKPVVSVNADGQVVMVGKARGNKLANALARSLMDKDNKPDFSMPHYLGYSGLDDAFLRRFVAEGSDLFRAPFEDLPVCTVGCAIGAHVGPDAVTVAYFAQA